MEERPIVFDAESVRAILDGSKTQTRRIVNPQPPALADDFEWVLSQDDEGWWQFACEKERPPGNDHPGGIEGHLWRTIKCPFGAPGDRLWVRSPWSVTFTESRNETWWSGPEGCGGLSFVTHGRPQKPKRLGKQSPRYMPRWVSSELRLPLLEVVSVRAERVQDITEDGAIAEGCEPHYMRVYVAGGEACGPDGCDARDEFRATWDELNANRGFPRESNPWVWSVEFRRMD